MLLVGCGKQTEFNDKRYCEAVVNAASALNASGTKDAANYLAVITSYSIHYTKLYDTSVPPSSLTMCAPPSRIRRAALPRACSGVA